jgi:hypothetical protein
MPISVHGTTRGDQRIGFQQVMWRRKKTISYGWPAPHSYGHPLFYLKVVTPNLLNFNDGRSFNFEKNTLRQDSKSMYFV